MVFLQKIKNNYYICEEKDKKRKYVKKLGRISDEEANNLLADWKKRLEIKPIFRTIVIDPPWPMEKIKRELFPNQVEMDYKTMSIEEIKEFPLNSFVNPEGCFIFLWTTQRFLPDALELLKTWNINYILTMVWHKNGGFQPFNLPQYNCEFVLMGRVGNLNFSTTKNFMCCFNGERGIHSEKPNEFYENINRVCPDPKIDIFARKERVGWDVYGYEVDKL